MAARYLLGDGADELIARWRPSDGFTWYLTDHQGTVRQLVNGAGTAVVNTIQYTAFGEIVSQTNPSAGDRFAYTGREWESEARLYYYRARFYDAAAGRFISQDPVSFEGGDANLYGYVSNNPSGSTDPSGMTASTEYSKKQASITTRLIKAAKCLGLNSATSSGTSSVVLGVYVYLFKTGNYAGRAMNMSRRAAEHTSLGKLPMATIQKQVFIAVNQGAARGTPGYDLYRVLEQIAIEVAEGMKSKGGHNSINGIDKSKWAKTKPGTSRFKAYQKYLKCK